MTTEVSFSASPLLFFRAIKKPWDSKLRKALSRFKVNDMFWKDSGPLLCSNSLGNTFFFLFKDTYKEDMQSSPYILRASQKSLAFDIPEPVALCQELISVNNEFCFP